MKRGGQTKGGRILCIFENSNFLEGIICLVSSNRQNENWNRSNSSKKGNKTPKKPNGRRGG